MSPSEADVHVVIPARLRSTRLPDKPLLDLAGKPMIVRVHDAVRQALPDADALVAADDVRILEALDEWGVPAVMTDRRWESGTDRVAEVARLRGWDDAATVINVQGDEPLLPGDLLRAFVDFCTGAPIELASVMVPIETHHELFDPNVVKVLTRADGTAITFSRAAIPFERDAPPDRWSIAAHRRHIGIYGYRNAVLQRITAESPCALERTERLEQLRAIWLGLTIRMMEWHVAPPGGVDTPEDLARVRAWLEVVA